MIFQNLLAAMLVATLAGCGGGGDPVDPADEATASADAATPSEAAQATATGWSGSNGCGSSADLASGKNTLESDGATREFWVSVPHNYNPNKPYKLIVGLHWRGGHATNVYNGDGTYSYDGSFFGLKKLYGDDAIYVAPQGLESSTTTGGIQTGWGNQNERDIHFMRSMVGKLEQSLCVNKKQVYAVGFSFGGMMANAIGCEMGGTFRAIASMSGSVDESGCANSSNKVAAILFHSIDDEIVNIKRGMQARDVFVSKNTCSRQTFKVGTNGCVMYSGCEANHPVVWCTGHSDGPDGGHAPPPFAASEIKTFFDLSTSTQ